MNTRSIKVVDIDVLDDKKVWIDAITLEYHEHIVDEFYHVGYQDFTY